MTDAAQPVHEALRSIMVENGCMLFAGRALTQLAAEVGRTPFYAYSRDAISARVQALRKSLPQALDLHYAMKANPMPAVVKHIATLVDGFDVASAGELAVALAAGVVPDSISFAGPGKTVADLDAALHAGVTVNLESAREMQRLAARASMAGRRGRVALRINPDFELKTSGMKMAGGPKQFGIDAEQAPEVLRELAGLQQLEFVGFHIFSGSQNLSADAIIDSQSRTIELAARLARSAPGPVRVLNIGGGFGIPYFARDVALNVGLIGRHLVDVVAQASQSLPEARVVLELGRYLVGEAGIYVCRVIERKVSRGQVFLITDGGLHHHLAASGNFGQVVRKNYPVVIGNKVTGTDREIASVVGPLCTPLDLLADRAELARADEGDLVVVLQSGAYGYTASPLGFLSHPPPVEILV